jgi:cysteine synthase
VMRREALFVGISSGANLAAIKKIVEIISQSNNTDRKINILTMAYDSVNDYLDLLD